MRVIDEPRKGAGRRAGDARGARRAGDIAGVRGRRLPRADLRGSSASSGAPHGRRTPSRVTGPYRFYDWDWAGATLIRALRLRSSRRRRTRWCTTCCGVGAILYGGNFAVAATALAQIGGFDRRIEFHGEDTNLGPPADRRSAASRCAADCWVWTSARRYRRDGEAAGVRPATCATSGRRSCGIVRPIASIWT